jgi:hypothetical protein
VNAYWRYTTRSLAANRVAYAHKGGGIETGLLLWFGAAHERNTEDLNLVRAFYEKRLASTHWSHSLTPWPGPIVDFFLGQIDESTLIDKAASAGRREQCYAQFALAARARELGRHAAYRKHLKLVAPGTNPIEVYDFYNVFPYFLARFELGKAGR